MHPLPGTVSVRSTLGLESAGAKVGNSVFIIAGAEVQNRDDRLMVLNDTALSTVEEQRGQHDTHVFSYQGHPVTKIHNSAWKRARCELGLPQVRVHDLTHTLGRLRRR